MNIENIALPRYQNGWAEMTELVNIANARALWRSSIDWRIWSFVYLDMLEECR
jgi:hypothetical protein